MSDETKQDAKGWLWINALVKSALADMPVKARAVEARGALPLVVRAVSGATRLAIG